MCELAFFPLINRSPARETGEAFTHETHECMHMRHCNINRWLVARLILYY